MAKRSKSINNRALTKADSDSVYGVIVRALGNCSFEVYCSDSMTRIAHIRGSMIKRVWIKEDDIVLCSKREGDGKHCDIELKYTDTEVKTLREGGYITDTFLNRDTSVTHSKINFSMI